MSRVRKSRGLRWLGWLASVVAVLALSELYRAKDSSPEELPLRSERSHQTGPAPRRADASELTAATESACHVGVLAAPHSVAVTSRASGRVASLLAEPGQRVQRGSVVAVLESAEAQDRVAIAQAELSVALAERRRAELDVERTRREHEQRKELAELVPAIEIERAEFEWQSARLAAEASRAAADRAAIRLEVLERELRRSQIEAPISGLLSTISVAEGEVVTSSQEIVRIIASEHLVARFAVPPELAPSIRVGQQIRAELEIQGQAIPAVIHSVAPEIDRFSRMLFAEAPIEPLAKENLAVGSVVRVSTDPSAESCLESEPAL